MLKPKGIKRSLTSYGDHEFSLFLRQAFLSSSGYDKVDLDRPIVGIANTYSDYTTCHRAMPELIEAIKRGVLEAGGLPMVFPTISLGEILISPTSMLYRNLLAMETEEMIKAYPMDSVVLLGGCDKTVPAQLMAAASVNIPTILEVTGAMPTGNFRGERVGACTDCRRYWALYRSGKISTNDLSLVQSSLCPASGTCMVMGSASTIACVAEAMGMMLPGGATPLSHSGERLRHGVATGRQAVAIARKGPRPRDILTFCAFQNAITVLSAIGGSTNTIIHLLALARRCNLPLTLEDFHNTAKNTPLYLNCKPAGTHYMEDFHRTGGVPALLKVLEKKLELEAKTISGKNLGEIVKGYSKPSSGQSVIGTLSKPIGKAGALAVIYGSLAPDGAIIKKAAASPKLFKHRGPAKIFDSPEEVAQKIDNPRLKITPDHILVLRNAGPRAAGMPEAGSIPIPKYLAELGVTDMVRVSDARMSGTAYGTIILHCAPEAAAGGPLALIKNNDIISVDIEKREINLELAPSILEARKKRWQPSELPSRGWPRLYAQHVQQAHLGADMDFLV